VLFSRRAIVGNSYHSAVVARFSPRTGGKVKKLAKAKTILMRLLHQWFSLGLGTHLFVKAPRQGDSKVTFSVFESSCHLLIPV